MKRFATLLALVLAGCTTVESYEVAVGRTRFTGAVHDEVYGQGLHSVLGKSLFTYNLREVQYPRNRDAEVIEVLTGDQLQVSLEVAHMWRISDGSCARDLFLRIGDHDAVSALVHKTYRESSRDAVAELVAADLLSEGRQGISDRIRQLMNEQLRDRCIDVTDFFVRDVDPPPTLKQAIESKLAKEQEVQEQIYQTQVVQEQANQQREEAKGIRDAQEIIAQSLQGEKGSRYLYWRAMEAMENVGDGSNNLVLVPTEAGAPIFFGSPNGTLGTPGGN